MQHTSPLAKGRKRGDYLYRTDVLFTRYPLLGASLILTNFYVLKKRMVVPNACDRNHQVDVYAEIREYFLALYCIDKQSITLILIKTTHFLPF